MTVNALKITSFYIDPACVGEDSSLLIKRLVKLANSDGDHTLTAADFSRASEYGLTLSRDMSPDSVHFYIESSKQKIFEYLIDTHLKKHFSKKHLDVI